MELCLKWVPMARNGLILSQERAARLSIFLDPSWPPKAHIVVTQQFEEVLRFTIRWYAVFGIFYFMKIIDGLIQVHAASYELILRQQRAISFRIISDPLQTQSAIKRINTPSPKQSTNKKEKSTARFPLQKYSIPGCAGRGLDLDLRVRRAAPAPASGNLGILEVCPFGIGLEKQDFWTAWDITSQTLQGLGMKLKPFILTFRHLDRHVYKKHEGGQLGYTVFEMFKLLALVAGPVNDWDFSKFHFFAGLKHMGSNRFFKTSHFWRCSKHEHVCILGWTGFQKQNSPSIQN